MIAVENILTRANYFNLSDPTVVLYWRAGRGLEISKRNRGIPPLVQAIVDFLKAGMSLMFESTNENYDFRGFGAHQCILEQMKNHIQNIERLYISNLQSL